MLSVLLSKMSLEPAAERRTHTRVRQRASSAANMQTSSANERMTHAEYCRILPSGGRPVFRIVTVVLTRNEIVERTCYVDRDCRAFIFPDARYDVRWTAFHLMSTTFSLQVLTLVICVNQFKTSVARSLLGQPIGRIQIRTIPRSVCAEFLPVAELSSGNTVSQSLL